MPLSRFLFPLRLGLLTGLLALTATLAAAEPYSPIFVETTGSGPKERIVGFTVNPLAETHPLDRQVSLNAPVRAAIESAQAENVAIQKVVQDEAFAQGLSTLSFGLGLAGAEATLIEQLSSSAAISGVYSELGTGLSYLGLALTVYQIALGPASGDGRPEIVNAYKSISGFLIGRFGTPGVQLAMLAGLPIDISLSYFGEAAWSAREDAWRQSYQKYYREMDEGAESANYGSDALEERVAEIRGHTEGGRTIDEWKLVLAWYLENIKRPENFNRVLEAEVRNYTQIFWDSARFSEYAADVDQATWGFARGASLTQAIKDKLEEEHYSTIMAELIRDVLPQIALSRFMEALKDQVATLNRTVRPELNAPLTMEISAFGLDAPAKFHMLLADGDTWTGTLRPGEPMRIALTKLAWLKAGFPDTIRLDHPDGALERRFVFEQDEALVVFGTPDTQGMIASFSREEGQQTCTITTRRDGRLVQEDTETRPSNPGTTVQTAGTREGYMILGRFDGTSWVTAAPGRVLGGARELPDARLALSAGDGIFAAPYFESIIAITDCKAEGTELITDVPRVSCRVHRLHRDSDDRGKARISRCTADMRLEFAGVWTEVDDSRQYVPFNRDLLEPFGREYKNLLENVPGSGLQ